MQGFTLLLPFLTRLRLNNMSRRIVNITKCHYVRFFKKEKYFGQDRYIISLTRDADTLSNEDLQTLIADYDAYQFYALYVCRPKIQYTYVTLKSIDIEESPIFIKSVKDPEIHKQFEYPFSTTEFKFLLQDV